LGKDRRPRHIRALAPVAHLSRAGREILAPSPQRTEEVLVERFSFASDVAFVPRSDLLDRVTVAPLTPSIFEGSLVQAAIFHVAPGGGLLRHPATYPQILAVLDGSGTVSGADGIEEPIVAGQAVYWQQDEEHETRSAHGLTALIIEGQSLDRFRERPASAS
jgi:quercetin dioxygenase-like cupin family protein